MPGGMSGLQILTAVRGTVPLDLKMSRFIGLSDTIDPILCHLIFDLATELGSKMVATCSLHVLAALVGGYLSLDHAARLCQLARKHGAFITGLLWTELLA